MDRRRAGLTNLAVAAGVAGFGLVVLAWGLLPGGDPGYALSGGAVLGAAVVAGVRAWQLTRAKV